MRLIDAEELKVSVRKKFPNLSDRCEINELINAAPSVEAMDYDNGEYDILDLLSSVWNGKQCYFKDENGMIYSRDTCKYMTLDEAISEFANRLRGENW